MATLLRKVQIWVLAGDAADPRVLVLQTNADRGSFWQPVTGNAQDDESLDQAAERELREETGLTGRILDTRFEFEFDGRWGRARERVFVLHLEHVSRVTIQRVEHQALEWVSLEEARRRVKFASNLEGLKAAIETAARGS